MKKVVMLVSCLFPSAWFSPGGDITVNRQPPHSLQLPQEEVVGTQVKGKCFVKERGDICGVRYYFRLSQM